MYSLEVGTIGDGIKLFDQQTCLEVLGIDGSSTNISGENFCQLARLILIYQYIYKKKTTVLDLFIRDIKE
jgi:hypothetical protein